MPEDSSPIDWKVESQRFDGVAALYDQYRPSYPAGLVEDILHLSGIQPGERILEIGSGTGKATLLFAQRGYSIVCLEPGQNLIDVAAKNLAAYPQVSFVKARFEEWEDEQKFDLVISAQAYHWVPEEVRYQKTAGVLKNQGHLGAFWNMYPGMEGKIWQELAEVYRKRAPELVRTDEPVESVIESRASSLRESLYFENITVRRYPWTARYSTQEYLGLLNTYSDHLRLPEERRGVLLREIAEVIARNGGTLERPYLAVVFMAQKRTST